MGIKLGRWLLVIAVVIGLAIPAPIIIASRNTGAFFLAAFILAPLGILLEFFFLLVALISRGQVRRMGIFALLSLPVATMMMLGAIPLQLDDRFAWLRDGATVKQRLANEPETSGELRHLEWAESGFAGINFFEYVVYDPSDRLATANSVGEGGHMPGIPCSPGIKLRFERGYYLVVFDLPWGDCDPR